MPNIKWVHYSCVVWNFFHVCVWRLLGKKIVNFQRPFFAWRALSHVVVCSSLLLYETVVAWFMKCWKWLLNNYLSFLRCFLASKKKKNEFCAYLKMSEFPETICLQFLHDCCHIWLYTIYGSLPVNCKYWTWKKKKKIEILFKTSHSSALLDIFCVSLAHM